MKGIFDPSSKTKRSETEAEVGNDAIYLKRYLAKLRPDYLTAPPIGTAAKHRAESRREA